VLTNSLLTPWLIPSLQLDGWVCPALLFLAGGLCAPSLSLEQG
jgi:hypothetical protein